MEISEQQILALFEDASQSFQQASPANQQALPGSVEAAKMTVGSGRQCSMLLSQSDPLGAFSKILLESSLWANSMEYCYVWERLDTKFDLSAFQLTPLGQSTDDSECLLLGTVTARHEGFDAGPHNGKPDSLHAAAKLWPTPTERDWKSTSHGNQDNARPLSEVAGLTGQGSLNPTFVEWLQGFPLGWTELQCPIPSQKSESPTEQPDCAP